MKKLCLTLYLSFFVITAAAQDSLYLVNTLLGAPENKLHFAGHAGDINNDGYADLRVTYKDSTYIFFGNSDFELESDIAVYRAFCPGDINNDGIDDFFYKKTNRNDFSFYWYDKLYLVYGGETLDMQGTLFYEQEYYNQIFGITSEPVGDLNGDGYNEFALLSPYNWSNGIGFVNLYLGGDTISNEPFLTIQLPDSLREYGGEDTFGCNVVGIGDVNNDGYDDILVSDEDYGYDYEINGLGSGCVFLYHGGPDMDAIADTVLIDAKGLRYGGIVVNLGDLNNDNKTDFAIAGFRNVDIFLGLDGEKIIYSPYHGGGTYNISSGNLNNDMYSDFLIGNTNNGLVGSFNCFLGSAEFETTVDYCVFAEKAGTYFSRYLDFIGDFNGDGYDDFVVLATEYPDVSDYENITGKLYLYSYKNHTNVKPVQKNLNQNFELLSNYPNPFNPSTTIGYTLNKCEFVQLSIYDIQGHKVKTLINEKKSAGRHQTIWNGTNQSGNKVSSGVYICQVVTESSTQSQKMILAR